jgi:hypothetical protein
MTLDTLSIYETPVSDKGKQPGLSQPLSGLSYAVMPARLVLLQE